MTTSLVYQHGQLRCGTIVVNDIDQAVAMYTEQLSQDIVEEADINESLAMSWAAPKLANAKSYLLAPSGSNQSGRIYSCLRLIQSPEYIEPVPHATTYGWCAYEISVKDVFALADKIEASDFNIVGPPKRLDGIANVIPMQVVGPDQEVLYLNQVLSSTEESDLPIAEYDVDQFFIAVLASSDRESATAEYSRLLTLDKIENHAIRYSLINRAFGFDFETTHSLSVLHKGRMPLIEVDQYPHEASQRQSLAGSLPLGNAMVSIAVSSIDELPLMNAISATPAHQQGLLYGESRSIVVRGRSNELIELIEIEQ